MKIKNLLLCFFLMAIGIGISSCEKEEQDVITKTEPPVYIDHTIKAPEENQMYTFECVETSKKDKEITATLTVLNEYIDYRPALTITTEGGKTVKYNESSKTTTQGRVYTYTFKMPDANISISVDMSIDNTEYTISKLPEAADVYLFECVDKAKRNETVTAKLTILGENTKLVPTFTITTASGANIEYNDSSEINTQGRVYSYTFKMPGENVTTKVAFDSVRRTITVDTKNTYLWVMNCYDENNPEVISSEAYRHVGFHFNTELGYEFSGTPVVTGDESGTPQTPFWNEEGTLNGYSYYPCWTFTMPGENATIKVHATEKTTYADKEFTGEYKGYQIAAGEKNIISGAATLDIDLNGNTSYTVTSTDVNEFNFRGEYTLDEKDNSFTYVTDRIYDPSIDNTDISMYSHGIRGQVLENGDIFFMAEGLLTNSADTYRYYYASKEACTYTCAARDAFGTYCLLEVTKASGTQYFFFDSYNIDLKAATVEFTSGTTISGDAEARILVDGEILYKYSHTTGNAPVFVGNDGVSGTYTGANGNLVLDGFGGATIGGETGTYTLNSNKTLVSVTINDVETIYVLSTSSKSYVLFDPKAWEGPQEFFATTTGTVGGTPCNARITVYVGTDLQGKSTPGQGAIKTEYPGATGTWQTMITATSAFVYNPIDQTLKFEKILTKIDPTQSSSYSAITFSVSEDLQTLTSTHETLYKYNATSNTISLKDVEIKAVTPAE